MLTARSWVQRSEHASSPELLAGLSPASSEGYVPLLGWVAALRPVGGNGVKDAFHLHNVLRGERVLLRPLGQDVVPHVPLENDEVRQPPARAAGLRAQEDAEGRRGLHETGPVHVQDGPHNKSDLVGDTGL